jgi:fructokinase
VILVVGEALIDLVISPAGDVQAALGGAPFNTARACGRLGSPVGFVGALSQDRFGSMLTQQLVDDAVDVSAAPRVDAPTTLAAAEIDDHGHASYRFYIEGTSAPALADVPDVDAAIVFTGGLGLVLEPMATAVERMLAERGDRVVMVDVNCRPLIVPDRDAYVARVERVLAAADVVKVSDDDLTYLFPGVESLEAARSILDRGPSVVLLTAGGEGAYVITHTGERLVPANRVDVVDTVGAGDSFGAGFLVAWTESGPPGDFTDTDRLVAAAGFGARVAGIVCGRRGADPPWRSELEPGS